MFDFQALTKLADDVISASVCDLLTIDGISIAGVMTVGASEHNLDVLSAYEADASVMVRASSLSAISEDVRGLTLTDLDGGEWEIVGVDVKGTWRVLALRKA